MKTKNAAPKRLSLAASALICCALNLPAQTAPTITTQPTNQTVVAGSNVTFTVAVSGTGPFTYQWQFNGTNLPDNITTMAGGGSGGDGGAATNASLVVPIGVALDTLGNLYVADGDNHRIRKVDGNGIITTVADNGIFGDSGDGGAATNATLPIPCGVALDSLGNLYIADHGGDDRVRKVDTNGIITTVAGGGNGGDGGLATYAGLVGNFLNKLTYYCCIFWVGLLWNWHAATQPISYRFVRLGKAGIISARRQIYVAVF